MKQTQENPWDQVAGMLLVEDATGSPPTIPFWLGEAPGRTTELSEEVSALRLELDRRLESPGEPVPSAGSEQGRNAVEGVVDWLMEGSGIPRTAAEQAAEYITEGERVRVTETREVAAARSRTGASGESAARPTAAAVREE